MVDIENCFLQFYQLCYNVRVVKNRTGMNIDVGGKNIWM